MYLMLCFEYFNSRISILDCVTSPGYNLHFARRVSEALTPLETLPHQSSPWSFGRDGVKRQVRKSRNQAFLFGLQLRGLDPSSEKNVGSCIHCGAPAPRKPSGEQLLSYCVPPISDPHGDAKDLLMGVLLFVSLFPYNFFNFPAQPKSFQSLVQTHKPNISCLVPQMSFCGVQSLCPNYKHFMTGMVFYDFCYHSQPLPGTARHDTCPSLPTSSLSSPLLSIVLLLCAFSLLCVRLSRT